MSDEKKKPTYWEQLRHPRWQKKRLEILRLHEFACSHCGATEKTLNVHHAYYEKGLAPWGYPDESLHCLCEDCHRETQDNLKLLQRQLGRIGLADVERLYGYALGLESKEFPVVALNVYSFEVACGVGDVWRVDSGDIIDLLLDGQIDGYRLAKLAGIKVEGQDE